MTDHLSKNPHRTSVCRMRRRYIGILGCVVILKWLMLGVGIQLPSHHISGHNNMPLYSRHTHQGLGLAPHSRIQIQALFSLRPKPETEDPASTPAVAASGRVPTMTCREHVTALAPPSSPAFHVPQGKVQISGTSPVVRVPRSCRQFCGGHVDSRLLCHCPTHAPGDRPRNTPPK